MSQPSTGNALASGLLTPPTSSSKSLDVEHILKELTLDEKVALTAGRRDRWAFFYLV